MKSTNVENVDERHEPETSTINDAHYSKSEWYAPKLKRVDINTTMTGPGPAADSNMTGSN